MSTSTIKSIAYALPTNIVNQQDLEERFGEKSVKSISKMSGVRERRVVSKGQCASDLAFAAARNLIEQTGIDPASIDLLTFASQTPDYRIPATSSVLHGRLGLSESCCTFDINQACSSFIHSLQVAHSMLVAGTARRALVLNGDAITTLINPKDRGLVALHGDGAAAALLEVASPSSGGFDFIETGTDGTKFDRLLVPAGCARNPSSEETRTELADSEGCLRNAEQLFMDGPAVFHFAVYKVPEVINKALAARGLTIDDFDLVLLHQANKTMVDLIYRALNVPPEKRYYFLENIGNSSGASLPTLLAQAWRDGVVKPGSRTLMAAFGGGLSWGIASISWSKDADAAVHGIVDVPFIPVKDDNQ